jgi:hypothetical protein
MNPNVIDIIPSWAVAMDLLILALESGDAEGRKMAKEELRNLGSQLDAIQLGTVLHVGKASTIKDIRERN